MSQISWCAMIMGVGFFSSCLGIATVDSQIGLGFQVPPKKGERVTIRVRISEGVILAKIRGFDLHFFQVQPSRSLPPEGERLAQVLAADKRSDWQLRCQGGAILLQALPSTGQPLLLKAPLIIRTPTGFIHFGNSPYRDELQIYSRGGQCEVVNVLDLEKYLDGLVNSEFSSEWNEESIEAQVVTARTYAFYQIQDARSRKGSHFDLDATVKDQVYSGSFRENFHSSRAAKKTQGIVLTVAQGKEILPIKAFYHSTCGGFTELPENVWGKSSPGFHKKVPCPYCSSSPRYRWTLDLRSQEISAAILKAVRTQGPLPGWPRQASRVLQQERLLDVRVSQLDPDGRVARLTLVWANGKTALELPISGVKFRNWLGAGRFRSTWFQLMSLGTGAGSRWHFQGRGNGHGVGLCQWGAKTMGEKGFKMTHILKHYYPDAALRKLW